jgi:uncharacterized protein (DUF302 family)
MMKQFFTIILILFSITAYADNSKSNIPADNSDNDPMLKLSEMVVTIPIKDNVSIDDAIDSMMLRANKLNVKFISHQKMTNEYKALGLKNYRRTEIFQFCDAGIAKQMLDYDINFLAYMPCRVGIIEDKKGKIWFVTMNMNIFISSANLPKDIEKLAYKIRDDLESIIEAGVNGEL